jgi:Mn2+/Fe2+ NRAMP family transporter
MRYRPGPGLLVAAAFLGPGTLATATVAGARAGYALLWAIPVAVLVAYVAQELAARVDLATGRPLARALAEEGPQPWTRWIALASVAAVVLGAAAFQAGNLTGAALGLEVLTTGPAFLWAIAVADVAFLLLWFGGYEVLETALAVLVTTMAAAFGAQVALVGLDAGRVAAGLVPSLDPATAGLALALVGTTVVPYNLFLHTSAVDADGPRDPDRLDATRTDLAVSLVLGGLVTACVLLAAASVQVGVVNDAADMALALEPLLGSLAEVTVGVGLGAAGLSSAVTAPLAAAWAVDQAREEPTGEPPRWVWAPVLLLGAAVASVGFEPVGLIVAAQAANAAILPLLVGACLLVANREVLGEHANGWLGNLAAGAALIATLALLGGLLL